MEALGNEIFSDILSVYSETEKNDERLRRLRTVAEKFFRILIKDYDRKVSGMVPMAFFILDRNPKAKPLEENFMGFIRLGNKAAHILEFNPTPEEVIACIKVFAAVISVVTQVQPPAEIEDIYRDKTLPELKHKAILDKERIPELSATIKSVVWRDRQGNRYDFIDLLCYAEEEGNFSVRIFKDLRSQGNNAPSASSLYHWGQLIPEYTRVYFFDLLQNKNKPDQYTIDFAKTRIVLEPDFLMEAKDTGSVFQSTGRVPLYYIISKLLPVDSNSSMFKGTLVNYYLDEYLFSTSVDPDETFDRLVNQNIVSSFVIKDELNKIKEDIKTIHIPVIKENIARIRGEGENFTVFTEPTFYSEKYGITGRLDILQISGDDPDRKNVIELKSGRVPKFGVWKQEEMQVTAYNMLLRSTFGSNRTGESSIFYSAAENTPFRSVSPDTSKEIEFLNGRNEAFLMLDLLRRNKDSLFSKMINYEGENLINFMLDNVVRFQTAYNASSEISTKYYRACVSFLINELFTSKMSASDLEGSDSSFAALWRQQPSVKEESFFSLIRDLTFDSYDEKEDVFRFRRHNPKVARFREGDMIILYPYTTTLEPLRRQILKGSIDSLNNEMIAIKLFNKQLDPGIFNQEKYFAIEPDFRDSNIMNTVTSMFDFLESFEDRKELILGLREPVSVEKNSEHFPGLEKSQKENVAKALAAKDYFLLQGPPGTGKTSKALMTMAVKMIEEPGQTVTILAFTNKAIKDVNKKLKEAGIDYLFLSASSDDNNSLRSMVKTHDIGEFGEFVKNLRVVTSTVTSFTKYNRDLRKFFRFGTVIVDEASQLLEPQLAGILTNFEKFILIGDQNQLPAVTVQSNGNTAVTDPDLLGLGLTEMKVSLFERLFNNAVKNGWSHAYGTLTEQFRMDESIMELINHYYHGRLRRATRETVPLSGLYSEDGNSAVKEMLLKNRLIFIESPFSKTGKKNDDEAAIVAHLVKTMRDSGLTGTDDIGIITPWRAQIAAIRGQLEMIGADTIPVDTVERFQGSENRVIIYSTAVSSQYHLERVGSIGVNRSQDAEVEVDRKLNVVLSRAQEQIIILGSVPILRISQHYRKLIEMIRQDGLYIPTPERKQIFGT